MTDITIYISANNGEEILILPVVPQNLPEIVQDWEHEEFTTNEKALTLIGKRKRKQYSLELLLPVNKNYRMINPKASSNGWDYINFWEKWSEKQVPMRLVITEGVNEILNFAYTIESLNYHVDKKKDIVANLTINEYIFTTEPIKKEEKPKYTWTELSVKYNGAGCKMKAANINGHWLVPARKLLEIMGYNVIWNPNEKAIYMTKDAKSYKLNTKTEIYEGTSYGYLYQICAELGCNAQWNKESRTAEIRRG